MYRFITCVAVMYASLYISFAQNIDRINNLNDCNVYLFHILQPEFLAYLQSLEKHQFFDTKSETLSLDFDRRYALGLKNQISKWRSQLDYQVSKIVQRQNGLNQYFIDNDIRGFEWDRESIIYKSFYSFLKDSAYNINDDFKRIHAKNRTVDSLISFYANVDTLNGYYIPKTLLEACEILNNFISKDKQDMISNTTIDSLIDNEYRFGIGIFLRNNWGLWRNTHIMQHLQIKSPKIDPETASLIILVAYYKWLRKEPIDQESILKDINSH